MPRWSYRRSYGRRKSSYRRYGRARSYRPRRAPYKVSRRRGTWRAKGYKASLGGGTTFTHDAGEERGGRGASVLGALANAGLAAMAGGMSGGPVGALVGGAGSLLGRLAQSVSGSG